jgi:hypothetical protein
MDAEIPINISVRGKLEENVVSISVRGKLEENVVVGGKESVNGNLVDVVKCKLPGMSCAFAKSRKRVFSNDRIRLVTKLRIFDTVVITNRLYVRVCNLEY